MVLTPVCLVQDGISGYNPTTNGVDVTPGGTISIKLASPAGATAWFLEIIGTDELSIPVPTLTGVNPMSHQATSPTTVVTFTFPNDVGRAIGFRSTVTGTGGPISIQFGIYSLTTFATRCGFVTETREGDPDFGWASKLNPLIRTGTGNAGPNNYSLVDVVDSQIVPAGQQMLYVGEINIEVGGELIVDGEIANVDHFENFSVLYVPPNTERVVRTNDEMLYTSDMVVDGQLTVNGQITDVTPAPPPTSGVTAYCHWYNDNDLGLTVNGSDFWGELPNAGSTDNIAVNIARDPGTTDFVVTYAGTYVVDVQMNWYSSSGTPDWLAVRAVRVADGAVMAQRAAAITSFNGVGTVTLHGLVEIFADGETISIEYCQPSNGGVGISMPAFGGTSGRHTTITIHRIGDALGDPPLA